jgi:putative hydrolase
VEAAFNKGLKQVAITDHGFSNMIVPIMRKQVPLALRQIEQAKKEFNIDVLFGVEANITSRDGDIDVTTADEQNLDLLLLGYHPDVYAKNFKERMRFFIPNYVSSIFGTSKKLIEMNTNAYLRAIEKNNIDILVHLGDKIQLDMVKIARHCKQYNVYLELNAKRTLFKENEMQEIINTGVKFILNSDAHNKNEVGECSLGIKFALKYNIPLEQLANINKLPKFKNHKKV